MEAKLEEVLKEVKDLEYEELGDLSRGIIEWRCKQLYHMHQLMCLANFEELYMSWIVVFPDCPNKYDYVEIAKDDELFKDCYNLFLRLICHKDYM